ncbi:type I restriction-modification system subunit M [Aneurinibacillus danicus]|uniref:site-specific DNA-methyltransferase (adenine-specific) n=1 Tax=Aneurinibacillus danicus TaxID=267746 RepID=A0A511VCL6_9BACL|nr:class I SAM-dependent DNA methyltransferase [Aneurinibacillus danicus]GEN36604.1 restriction-modification system protein [Aneurinibacillus danicus]
MNNVKINEIISFIWGIADDVLRDVLVRGKYRDVILPMTVIRRIDALLEPTKAEVERTHEFLNERGITNQDLALRKASGYVFYNTSKFTLRRLLDEPSQLRENFEAYLAAFSPNMREIVQKFKFHNQLETLEEANVLYKLVEKYIDPKVKLEELTNLEMGYVFEELIRRFNEENNEEAGEHFTPRDVVGLMTHLLFEPIQDKIESTTYVMYDGACGTGGMLTESEAFLTRIAEKQGKKVKLELYGQEVQPETFAICQSDMMIKGKDPENIKYGSTLSRDRFPDMKFDFMIMNPPYGKSWKVDLEEITDKETGKIDDPRFHMGVPRSSDGQLLFMVNMLSKMKESTELGSRIATIHNGSALFTGDAGQGESNIRKWIIENDWLEALIALPNNMFYNTGIATYIWVLTNRKSPERKGKVQLIDATNWYQKMRKNLGQKGNELTEEHVTKILEVYKNFKETPESKIFANEEFGYTKITVERPLRLAMQVTDERIKAALFTIKAEVKKYKGILSITDRLMILLKETFGFEKHMDFNVVIKQFESALKAEGMKVSKNDMKKLLNFFTERDEQAAAVIKKKTKTEILYEPDPELRDIENIPLQEDINEYFKREVLPYVPDAWIDYSKNLVGYEVSFNRYFYKYQEPESLEDIYEKLLKIEKDSAGMLHEILEKVK